MKRLVIFTLLLSGITHAEVKKYQGESAEGYFTNINDIIDSKLPLDGHISLGLDIGGLSTEGMALSPNSYQDCNMRQHLLKTTAKRKYEWINTISMLDGDTTAQFGSGNFNFRYRTFNLYQNPKAGLLAQAGMNTFTIFGVELPLLPHVNFAFAQNLNTIDPRGVINIADGAQNAVELKTAVDKYDEAMKKEKKKQPSYREGVVGTLLKIKDKAKSIYKTYKLLKPVVSKQNDLLGNLTKLSDSFNNNAGSVTSLNLNLNFNFSIPIPTSIGEFSLGFGFTQGGALSHVQDRNSVYGRFFTTFNGTNPAINTSRLTYFTVAKDFKLTLWGEEVDYPFDKPIESGDFSYYGSNSITLKTPSWGKTVAGVGAKVWGELSGFLGGGHTVTDQLSLYTDTNPLAPQTSLNSETQAYNTVSTGMYAGLGVQVKFPFYTYRKVFKLLKASDSRDGDHYSLQTPQIRAAKCASKKGESRYNTISYFLGEQYQCDLAGIKSIDLSTNPFSVKISDLHPIKGRIIKSASNSTYFAFITEKNGHYYRYSYYNQSNSNGRRPLKSGLSYEDETGYAQDLGTEKVVDLKISSQVAYILSKNKDGRYRLRAFKNHSRRKRWDDTFTENAIGSFAQDGYDFYYTVGKNIYHSERETGLNGNLVAAIPSTSGFTVSSFTLNSRASTFSAIEFLAASNSRMGSTFYAFIDAPTNKGRLQRPGIGDLPPANPGVGDIGRRPPRVVKYKYVPAKIEGNISYRSKIVSITPIGKLFLVETDNGQLDAISLERIERGKYKATRKTLITKNAGQVNIISKSADGVYLQILIKEDIDDQTISYKSNTYFLNLKKRVSLNIVHDGADSYILSDDIRRLGAFYRGGQTIADNYLTTGDMLACYKPNFNYKEDLKEMEDGEDGQVVDKGVDRIYNQFSLDPWKNFTTTFYNNMKNYHLCYAINEKQIYDLGDTFTAIQERTPCHSTIDKLYCESVNTLHTAIQTGNSNTIDQEFDLYLKVCKTDENGNEEVVGLDDHDSSLIDYTLWTPQNESSDVDNSAIYKAYLIDKNGQKYGPVNAELFTSTYPEYDGFENVQTGKYLFNYDRFHFPRGKEFRLEIKKNSQVVMQGLFATALPRFDFSMKTSSLYQNGITDMNLPIYVDSLTSRVLKQRSLVIAADKAIDASTPYGAKIRDIKITFDYKQDSFEQDWREVDLNEFKEGGNRDFLFNRIGPSNPIYTFNENRKYVVALKVTYELDGQLVSFIIFDSVDYSNF